MKSSLPRYLDAFETRLRVRVWAWGAGGVVAAVALGACLDPGDYRACVDKADRSKHYLEFCAPAPSDGVCPDYDGAAANAMAHASVDRGNCGQEGRTAVDVACGPENSGEEEPQLDCCYVAKIVTEAADNTCAVGRPFFVGDAPRTAEARHRSDWGAPSQPRVPASGAVRRQLAEHWTEAGLAEHASIASFARFTLDLLALGAPSELLAQTQAAISDEVRHARLCFGLASAYAGQEVGPGPLQTADALPHVGWREIVAAAIVEGCIGETLAAIEAAHAACVATDPAVVEVLEGIRDDESRHAELAWSFVAWALSERPFLRPFVARTFESVLTNTTAPEEDEGGHLTRHGVLNPEARQDIRVRACKGMLRRSVRVLLSQSLVVSTGSQAQA